jgi:hypothetical protein
VPLVPYAEVVRRARFFPGASPNSSVDDRNHVRGERLIVRIVWLAHGGLQGKASFLTVMLAYGSDTAGWMEGRGGMCRSHRTKYELTKLRALAVVGDHGPDRLTA